MESIQLWLIDLEVWTYTAGPNLEIVLNFG
jgi:hypothetical protein